MNPVASCFVKALDLPSPFVRATSQAGRFWAWNLPAGRKRRGGCGWAIENLEYSPRWMGTDLGGMKGGASVVPVAPKVGAVEEDLHGIGIEGPGA